jgi:hypothetical protein
MYVNPYQSLENKQGKWLKANFHVHAYPDGSGKRCQLTEVISMYKDAGYDVLTISDQEFFVDTQDIGKRLGIFTINGIENVELDGILCIGVNEFLRGNPQDIIEESVKQGGFCIIPHPNWISEDGLPPVLPRDVLKKLNGYIGLEILNPTIFNGFLGSGLATDVWDEFLTEGKLIWGFANDDFHAYHNFDNAWNMIYANELSYESIKDAVKRGSLFASTGLFLHEFSFNDNMLRVEANFYRSKAKKIRYQFIGESGKLLEEAIGETGIYRFKGDELYVRVQATSEDGSMLWTQPVYHDSLMYI